MYLRILLLTVIPFSTTAEDEFQFNKYIVEIERVIKKSGMHLEVETNINIPFEELPSHCHSALVENVTSSFYVDQYEIKRAVGFYNSAYFKRNIDVELPSYLSHDHEIMLFAPLEKEEAGFKAHFLTPWHIRYHEIGGKDYQEVKIMKPKFYLSCKYNENTQNLQKHNYIMAPCPSENTSFQKISAQCVYIECKTIFVNEIESIPVPIGIKHHALLVSTLTLLSSWLGVLYIIYMISFN